VGSLARELGVTPNYLSALFAKEVGRTLTQDLRRVRLEHAQRLRGGTQAGWLFRRFHPGPHE
jgi:AraC-like DNA-binding protein